MNRHKRHGFSKAGDRHPLYSVFYDMRSRCYKVNHKLYKYYGKRGIKICKEWFDDVATFIKWGVCNGYKKGLQIDRIDNDGNYNPLNCRFVTSAVNIRNSRNTKLNWNLVNEIRNIKLLMPNIINKELSLVYGVSTTQIWYILTNKSWKQ